MLGSRGASRESLPCFTVWGGRGASLVDDLPFRLWLIYDAISSNIATLLLGGGVRWLAFEATEETVMDVLFVLVGPELVLLRRYLFQLSGI